jgi:hypothetical protein
MGQIQIGAVDDGSGWNEGMAFPYAVESRRVRPRDLGRAANGGGLIGPDFRAYFAGTAYCGF